MDIEISRNGSAVIATPKGRVDGMNAAEFADSLSSAVSAEDLHLLVDLSELSYISSAGLRVILSQAKAMHGKEGKLELCAAAENVLEVLKISGFDQILSIHDTQEAALAASV